MSFERPVDGTQVARAGGIGGPYAPHVPPCAHPQTYANCSVLDFGEVSDCWPIVLGHPCVGCTEQKIAFRIAMHDTVAIERPRPPDTYPAILDCKPVPTPFEHGVRLSSLPANQRARVVRVLHGDRARADRLMALGVTPGATITVLQTFPGVIFQCDETEVAVESEVAGSIIVEPL